MKNLTTPRCIMYHVSCIMYPINYLPRKLFNYNVNVHKN